MILLQLRNTTTEIKKPQVTLYYPSPDSKKDDEHEARNRNGILKSEDQACNRHFAIAGFQSSHSDLPH